MSSAIPKLNKLERLHPEIEIVRGDSFLQNLICVSQHPKYQNMIEKFRQRELVISKEEVSYRVLSHWDSEGLLMCERDGDRGWRRFNLIERLWVQVVLELRRIGLSLSHIRNSMPYFFEPIGDGSWGLFSEYYCLSVLTQGRPSYFVIFSCGQADFLDYFELENAQAILHLRHFVSVSLNELLSSVMKKSLNENFPISRKYTIDHHKLYELIEQEDFDFMRIVKEKGLLKGYEYQKSFSGKCKEKELVEGYKDYELKSKVVDGYVTSKTRTVREKVLKK